MTKNWENVYRVINEFGDEVFWLAYLSNGILGFLSDHRDVLLL
jgi:hypothetical protein